MTPCRNDLLKVCWRSTVVLAQTHVAISTNSLCLSATGSMWFSPSDTKLTRMTFSLGESLGSAGFFALPWPVLWIYQPGYAVHLAHDAMRHESLLKARRAAHPSGQVDQCEKPSCAGENGSPLDRHATQVRHIAQLQSGFLQGLDLLLKGSHQLIGPCSCLRIICQTNTIGCHYTQPPWKRDGGWDGCEMNILAFSGQK